MNDYIIKTTDQWNATSMIGYIIPVGTICIEARSKNDFMAKIGDGTRSFPKLPYLFAETFNSITQEIGKLNDNILNRYTKNEIDTFIGELKELIQNIDLSSYVTEEMLKEYTQPLTIEEKEKIKEIKDFSPDIEAVNQRIDDLDFSEYAKKEELHQHDNKVILDETTASFTVAYKNILDNWVSSDYATVQYVDDKIADIIIPDIDLSEYAKKTWVIDKIEEIIPPDSGIQDIQVKQNDVGVLVSTKPNSITEDLDVFQYLNVMTINCGFSDT